MIFLKSLLFLLFTLLSTQLGKHFWISESLVLGRKIDLLSPTLYLTDIIILIIILLNLVRKLQKKGNLPTVGITLLFFLLLFLFYQAPSLLLYFSIKIIEFGVLAHIIYEAKITTSELILPLTISVVFTSLLGILQFLNQKSLGGWLYFLGERGFSAQTPGISQMVIYGRLLLRPYSILPHPNVFGGLLATTLPILLFTRVQEGEARERVKFKILYFLKQGAIILCLSGIFVSFSRTAWTAGTITLIYYLFIAKKPVHRPPKFLILAAVIFLLVFEEVFIGRIGSLITTEKESFITRAVLNSTAWEIFRKHPLIGAGWGKFILESTRTQSPLYFFQPVHSIYLLTLAEAGILGLAGLLFIIIKSLQKTFLEKNFALFFGIITIVFLGAFDHYFLTVQQTQLLFTIVLALSFIRYKKSYNQKA